MTCVNPLSCLLARFDNIIGAMAFAQNLISDEIPPLRVGSLRLAGRAMLAPMAGVTDVGMRRIAARHGAALTFSEMVASRAFLAGDGESRSRAAGGGVRPLAVQIVGADPLAMAETARAVEGAGAEIVDINMGCPAKRVAGQLAGSALMRDLDAAERLIASVVGAVRVPVTLKMRLGWDDQTRNAPDLARRAESVGVAMISVHGRTRCQFYRDAADWAAVRGVVEAVRLPVMVNGDGRNAADARAMLAASGAAGVMIGRAAIGAPWRIGAIARALESGGPEMAPSRSVQRDDAIEHLESILDDMGVEHGLRHARKHLAAYVESVGAAPELRRALVTATSPDDARRLVRQAFEAEPERAAA